MATDYFVPNQQANAQIAMIAQMVGAGLTDAEIAETLTRRQARNLRTGLAIWSASEIEEIKTNFKLQAVPGVAARADFDASETPLVFSMVHCRGCGAPIHATALSCPKCGARQQIRTHGKSKLVAGLLAFFLGSLGIHRFYLGQWWGLFYLLFFWTFIPFIIAFIEGIAFLLTDDEEWERHYG